ncbi:MAG: hypothetical protein AMXMBFR84_02820 [Candidatus Hydrogenedentota bacterium]
MKTMIWCGLLSFGCLAAFAQPSAPAVTAGMPVVTQVTSQSSPAINLEEQGFLSVRAIRGKGWAVEKYKATDGLWHARLMAKNALVEDFANAGQYEDWIRLGLWPLDAETPRLLFVLRYGGGADGPDYLDIIRLDESYRNVFRSGDGINLIQISNLDEAGFPEIVFATRHYRYDLLGLNGADAPRPRFVMAFDDQARQFVTANHRFESVLRPEANRLRQAFESHPKYKVPFTFETGQIDRLEPLGFLTGYLVQSCYLGEPDKAWAYLDAFADTATAARIRTALNAKLAADPVYQDILKRAPLP